FPSSGLSPATARSAHWSASQRARNSWWWARTAVVDSPGWSSAPPAGPCSRPPRARSWWCAPSLTTDRADPTPLSHTRHSGNDKATIGDISARVEASGPSICSAGVAAHPGSLPTYRERTPTMGTIIAWIIVGGLAGWIASMIMGKNAQMGLIANIVSGVVGAFVVGWIVSFFTSGDGGAMPDAFSIGGVVASIVGACLVTVVVSAITGRGRSKV